MTWKRQLHWRHGTGLIETRIAQLWSGEALNSLSRELTRRGIVLDPNPYQPVPSRKLLEHAELLRTFRPFLTPAKSDQLDADALRQRLENGTVTQGMRDAKSTGDVSGSRWFRCDDAR